VGGGGTFLPGPEIVFEPVHNSKNKELLFKIFFAPFLHFWSNSSSHSSSTLFVWLAFPFWPEFWPPGNTGIRARQDTQRQHSKTTLFPHIFGTFCCRSSNKYPIKNSKSSTEIFSHHNLSILPKLNF
jgi:hypothetical protein